MRMGLFKQFIIKSSLEINTTPMDVWNFFYQLESNYKKWHPTDYNNFRWTKGNSLEIGSMFDSEEYGGWSYSKDKR